MGDIPKYLDKYQELCSEQLTYLSQRMAHRIALDREIDELFEKAMRDTGYLDSLALDRETIRTGWRISRSFPPTFCATVRITK